MSQQIINALDWSDVIKLVSLSEDDIVSETERYKTAVDLYKKHIFEGTEYSNILAQYVASMHQGSLPEYFKFVKDYHDKNTITLSQQASHFFIKEKVLPMVPEIIAHDSETITTDNGDIYSANELDQWIQAHPDFVPKADEDIARTELIRTNQLNVISANDLEMQRRTREDSSSELLYNYIASKAGLLKTKNYSQENSNQSNTI
ncbi:MAG: hypothetical protein WCO23_02255 [bacterium]